MVARNRRALLRVAFLLALAASAVWLSGAATRARADQNPKEQFDVVGENYHGKLSVSFAPATFPERRLLLTLPRQTSPVLPAQVHVLEDGQPVTGIALTTLAGTADSSHYEVYYRSARPYGEHEVELDVRVDGVDTADLDYNAPASPGSAARQQAVPPAAGDENDGLGAGSSPRPFLASGSGLIVAALGAGLLFTLALFLWLLPRRRRHELRDRVDEFASPAAVSPSPALAVPTREERLAATERMLARFSWWGSFKESVELGRVGRSAIELVAIDALATAALAVLAGLAAGAVPAVLTLLLGPLALRLFVGHRVRKQRELFSEQLGGFLDELSSSLRAGHGLVAALATSVRTAPEPSRTEWGNVVSDETLGVSLDEAMSSLAQRMASDDVEQVALVASLHQRTGGNMAEVLDRVADAVRERAELRRQLRTLSAQARMSRWVLTALPVVIALLTLVIDPSYVQPLYTTAGGLVALGLAASLVTVGSLILRKLTEIEV